MTLPLSVCDIAAGMNAYEATLEALIGRACNGRGALLSISMFDAMADWASTQSGSARIHAAGTRDGPP